jgi:O-glycosyl hydrolase
LDIFASPLIPQAFPQQAGSAQVESAKVLTRENYRLFCTYLQEFT